METLKKIKRGKRAVLDRITVKFLKCEYEKLIERIMRLFRWCVEVGKVPED